MGMFDEIHCDAALPDCRDPPDKCFQTKSFPQPCMCRYRITGAERLIDTAGNDREYRARFSSGQLQNIERVTDRAADRIRYGLASFRWFEQRSHLLRVVQRLRYFP